MNLGYWEGGKLVDIVVDIGLGELELSHIL